MALHESRERCFASHAQIRERVAEVVVGGRVVGEDESGDFGDRRGGPIPREPLRRLTQTMDGIPFLSDGPQLGPHAAFVGSQCASRRSDNRCFKRTRLNERTRRRIVHPLGRRLRGPESLEGVVTNRLGGRPVEHVTGSDVIVWLPQLWRSACRFAGSTLSWRGHVLAIGRDRPTIANQLRGRIPPRVTWHRDNLIVVVAAAVGDLHRLSAERSSGRTYPCARVLLW